MALQIVRQDRRGYSLIDETGTVGWLRGDAIAFRGFACEADTLRAAALAHATKFEMTGRSPGAGLSRTARRFGVTTWATDDTWTVGGERVGRFLRPSPVPGLGLDSFGFELSLADVPLPRREALARRMHEALAALRVAEMHVMQQSRYAAP